MADRPRCPPKRTAAAPGRPGDVRSRRQRQHRPGLAVPVGVVRGRLGQRRLLGPGRAGRGSGPDGLPTARVRADRGPALFPLRRRPAEADREAAARHAAARSVGRDRRARRTSGLHPLLLRAFEDRAHEAIHGTPADELRPVQVSRPPDRSRGGPRMPAGRAPSPRPRRDRRPDDDPEHRPSPAGAGALATASRPDADDHPWDERLLERLELIHR